MDNLIICPIICRLTTVKNIPFNAYIASPFLFYFSVLQITLRRPTYHEHERLSHT